MKTGVAAVALAASALLAPTATAQDGFRSDRAVSADQLRGGALTLRDRGNRSDFRRDRRDRRNRGNRGVSHVNHHGPQLNGFGQTFEEAKYLADEASYACACQLELDGHKYGFKEAGFKDTPYVEQIGQNRFLIKGKAKLFDGYDYTIQHYECAVRRGNIRNATRLTPANYAARQPRRRSYSFGSFGFSFGGGY